MVFFCIWVIVMVVGLWKTLTTPPEMVKCPHCWEEFDGGFHKVEKIETTEATEE